MRHHQLLEQTQLRTPHARVRCSLYSTSTQQLNNRVGVVLVYLGRSAFKVASNVGQQRPTRVRAHDLTEKVLAGNDDDDKTVVVVVV
jgi:hypothetical protein